MTVVGDPTGNPFPPKPQPQPCAAPEEPINEQPQEPEEDEENGNLSHFHYCIHRITQVWCN